MKKWCFIDLDGTLLTKTKKISKKNLDSLKKYVENGNKYVLTTGRWPVSTLKLSNVIFSHTNIQSNYIISLNGSYIYDLKNNKIAFKQPIRKDVFEKLLDVQKIFKISMWIYSESGIENKTIYSKKIPFKKIVSKFNCGQVVGLDENFVKNDDNYKVLFMSFSTKKISKLYKWLLENFEDYLTIIRTSSKNIEITNKNVDKGFGVEFIQKKEKISTIDTYALGDSGNDVAMFKKCGFRVAFSKNKELNNLSNYSYKNNKKLNFVLDKINELNHTYYDENISIKLNIENLPNLDRKIYIANHLLLWNYLLGQNKLILELKKYPNWLVRKLFKEFLIDRNVFITSSNYVNHFSEKEQKFLFAKSFSDTQQGLILNSFENKSTKLSILENENGETLLIYDSEVTLNDFLNKFNFKKSDFNSLCKLSLIDLKNKLKTFINITVYGVCPEEFTNNFEIFSQSDLHFVYRKNSNNEKYQSKDKNIKEFEFKTFNAHPKEIDILNNFLQQHKK